MKDNDEKMTKNPAELLHSIAARLKIDLCPDGLYHYDVMVSRRKEELCSFDMIRRLQDRFDLFGEFYTDVLEAWEDLQSDPDRLSWVNAASLFIKDVPHKDARKVCYPETNGTRGGDMMPLFALLPSVEEAYEEYCRRGLPQEDLDITMQEYKINLRIVRDHAMGRVGLNAGYVSWLCLYAKARIFRHGSLNFEIHQSPSYCPYLLKNEQSGAIVPVFGKNMVVHRNGVPLGSYGYEDEWGSFDTYFEENVTAYVGHPATSRHISRERVAFPKNQWELVFGPGDRDLSVHIPRKTDLSPKAVDRSLAEAVEIANHCYPEWPPKALYCSSWLLSPMLNEILGKGSAITAFSSRFERFPRKDAGLSVFSFVFPAKFASMESLEELPENTRLEKALKQKYLNGQRLYTTSGFNLL